MASTATSTSTHTRTHTATYLTDVVLGTIGDLLADLGIDATRLYRDWSQDEAAIKKWIEEESLDMVVLEVVQPSGKTAPIVEFPVSYTAVGLGDAAFTAQRAQLARYRAKLERVPAGSSYRLFCTYRASHTAMPGWYPGTRASTSGMQASNFGILGSAPHATASMRVLR
jgi:hypothetical protein